MNQKVFNLYPKVKKIISNNNLEIQECYDLLSKYCNMKDTEKEILQQITHVYNSKKGLI